MKLSIPRAVSRAVEETVGGYAFTRDWSKYLRNMWTILGFDHNTGMYGDLPLHLVEHPATIAVHSDLKAAQLADASTTAICKAGKLPNNWQEGTSLEPFVEWARGAGASGDVVLALGYAAGSPGDTFTETEEELAAITVSAEGELVRTTFTAISGAALNKGDACLFAFKRKGGAVGDTFSGDVMVYNCGVRVKLEGVGHEKAHP